MRTRAPGWWMIGVAGLVALGACGDILHATNWDTRCDVAPDAPECGGDGSGGAAGASADGGSAGVDGGGRGVGGSGGAPLTYPQACQLYAEAYCPRLTACRPILYEVVGGTSECEARLVESCVGYWSGDGLSMTPDDLAECFEAIDFPGSSCERVVRLSAGQVLVPECRIAGTRPEGDACLDGHQCQGLLCRPGMDTPCGTCGTVQQSGGACTADYECDPGLRCGAMGMCTPLLEVGASCASHAECFVDLYCIGGTCQPRLAPDAGCDPTVNVCAVDYYCGASNVCETYSYAPENQTCGSLAGQLVGCEYGSYCEVIMSGDSSGVCVAQGEPDQPCPTGLSIFAGPCRYPGGCWAGTCIVPNATECN